MCATRESSWGDGERGGGGGKYSAHPAKSYVPLTYLLILFRYVQAKTYRRQQRKRDPSIDNILKVPFFFGKFS